MNEEDEEHGLFNEFEIQARQRRESVRAALREAETAFDEQYPIWKRNQVIEEVAQHIEKLKGFGQDTVSSLAIYIREMKK